MRPPCCTNSRKCCSGATRPISPPRCRRCRTRIAELRSSVAQRAVLNVELAELQRALAEAWRLPALIVESTAEAKATGQTSARIVALAARLARHTARDWDNAALPDDLSEISALLNLSHEATLKLLLEI